MELMEYPRIVELHNECVRDDMRQVERCAQSKVRTDGRNKDEKTGNMGGVPSSMKRAVHRIRICTRTSLSLTQPMTSWENAGKRFRQKIYIECGSISKTTILTR